MPFFFFFGIQKKSMRIQGIEFELTAHEFYNQILFHFFFSFFWAKSFGSVVKGLSLMTITYGPAQVFH